MSLRVIAESRPADRDGDEVPFGRADARGVEVEHQYPTVRCPDQVAQVGVAVNDDGRQRVADGTERRGDVIGHPFQESAVGVG